MGTARSQIDAGDRVFFELAEESAIRGVAKRRKSSMATVESRWVKFARSPSLRAIRFIILCDRPVLSDRRWTVKRSALRLVKKATFTDEEYDR